jgi:hypothetical protein
MDFYPVFIPIEEYHEEWISLLTSRYARTDDQRLLKKLSLFQ